MQAELRALIERHCETLKAEANGIRQCVENLNDKFCDEKAVMNEAIERAHKVKGSSGSMGFSVISECAKDLEYALRALRTAPHPLDAGALHGVKALYALLAGRIETVLPQDSALYSAPIPNLAQIGKGRRPGQEIGD